MRCLDDHVNELLGRTDFQPYVTNADQITGVEWNDCANAYQLVFSAPDPQKEWDRTQGAQYDAEEAASGATWGESTEKGGIEIRFPSKPAPDVLQRLKSHGWRWSRFSKCWYTRASDSARALAAEIARPIASGVLTEEYTELEHGRIVHKPEFGTPDITDTLYEDQCQAMTGA